MNIQKALIIDDEELIRKVLSEILERQGLDVTTVSDGKKAIKLAKQSTFDIVFTDMKMPEMSGLEVVKGIKEVSPRSLITVVTAFGSIENAVEAMQLGAFHYILKPFSPEAIQMVLNKASEHTALVDENTYLKEECQPQGRMVCHSDLMKKLLAEVKNIAMSNSSVFIHGESGVGKEVMAHYIHTHSLRNKHPFVKVNCAAVAETLMESEFFGHEKGAFTGASAQRKGRFELANKGTLLLDEVSEISLNLQAKLLRVTQEKEFERVGGTKPIKVDTRLISTSNRNMDEVIAQKILREDLYYRLNVIPIHIPPLRERIEDIIPLAETFVTRFCKENHRKPKKLSADAKAKLQEYSWPGNVRELGNIIERAVVMLGDKVTIDADHLYITSRV